MLTLIGRAGAETRHIRVRLFWLHPPSVVKISMVDASAALSLRPEVAHSQPHRVINPVVVTAEGSRLRASGRLWSQAASSGRVRVEGDGFANFEIASPLTITADHGRLRLTARMPLEDYVAAVLVGEAGGFKSDEALKAMAVAARTYAVRFVPRHAAEGFDFCDTTHCQDLRLGVESLRVRAAASATEGELLWFEGQPAATYYSRSCGGMLEGVNVLDSRLKAPYLREREDQFCLRSDRGEWRSEISKSDLRQALESAGVKLPPRLHSLAAERRLPSGRVEMLAVDGIPIPAGTLRLAVGRTLGWDQLRSDLYELQDDGEHIIFHGRGQGHGVGLCQTGAEAMGADGKDYREILAYYYPGTLLGINAQGLRWQALAGEEVEVLTTQPNADRGVVVVAERALKRAQQATGWTASTRPQVRVFPTVSIYRDTTGQPGWVAASTRGRVIRIEPPSVLGDKLEATLQHEFLHLLVESRARPDLPLWFREGLVLWLLQDQPNAPTRRVDLAQLERDLASGNRDREVMRAAYAQARAAIAAMAAQYGKDTVLSWVTKGLPPSIASQEAKVR